MRQAGFAYAQARMQARFADRPTALDWQMIETGRDFSQALDATRRGAFAEAVGGLGRDSDRDAIEAALRRVWAAAVAEVAAWVPAPWRPALEWIALLPHLRLVADGVPPALPGAAALTGALEAGATPDRAWRAGFADRLPRSDPGFRAALAPLTDRFLHGPPRPAADTAALIGRLERLLRRRAQEPVAAFAWLGLLALDLERLRGALVLARLFPAAGEGT